MIFAYADPPYLGQCKLYKHNHPAGDRPFDGKCWNDVETHSALVSWLCSDFPDGWAMSMSAPSITDIAPMLPSSSAGEKLRWGAWTKPFASFKPGVNPGYCWEPVVFCGGRKLGKKTATIRDYVAANITLGKGIGAKPTAFCDWVMDFLGWQPNDEFIDIFTGSGAFGDAVRRRQPNDLGLETAAPVAGRQG